MKGKGSPLQPITGQSASGSKFAESFAFRVFSDEHLDDLADDLLRVAHGVASVAVSGRVEELMLALTGGDQPADERRFAKMLGDSMWMLAQVGEAAAEGRRH